jgi:Lipid A 3-O-deacylase (PagL)
LRNLLGATILIVALATSAFAQQTNPPPEGTFRKGQTEFGLLVGVDFAMDIWDGLPDSEFLSLGFRLSHVVTGPIAAGPCRGNFVISGEVNPLMAFHDDYGTAYAFSSMAMLRYYFAPGAKVRPFISAGGGIVLSATPIPHEISRLNFNPQGGGGLAIPLRGGAVLSMEYRIHHMSDGLLTEINPGVNSSEFLVGVSWLR